MLCDVKAFGIISLLGINETDDGGFGIGTDCVLLGSNIDFSLAIIAPRISILV
jgi:hypothetical protein